MGFFGPILEIADTILRRFRPEEKKRRIKEEIDKLIKERNALFEKKDDPRAQRRALAIIERVRSLEESLKNF